MSVAYLIWRIENEKPELMYISDTKETAYSIARRIVLKYLADIGDECGNVKMSSLLDGDWLLKYVRNKCTCETHIRVEEVPVIKDKSIIQF